MPQWFYMKRGDTLPVLRYNVIVANEAVDLTSVTAAKFRFTSGTTTVERTGTVASPATSGVVTYTFVSGDWSAAFTTGKYSVELMLTFATGIIQTYPTRSYDALFIAQDNEPAV